MFIAGRETLPPMLPNENHLKTWGTHDVNYTPRFGPGNILSVPSTGFLVVAAVKSVDFNFGNSILLGNELRPLDDKLQLRIIRRTFDVQYLRGPQADPTGGLSKKLKSLFSSVLPLENFFLLEDIMPLHSKSLSFCGIISEGFQQTQWRVTSPSR